MTIATAFAVILDNIRNQASSEREKGALFEALIAQYLRHDPLYGDRFSQVWLWNDWPDRQGQDVGIDLVAQERLSGDYWAIQCKFYAEHQPLSKGDIDSFFTASGQQFTTASGLKSFANRLIVTTTDGWSKHAEEALQNQTIPVERLSHHDLAQSAIDWSLYDIHQPLSISLKAKKQPRPHQIEAITNSLAGFKTHERGRLIMACGTGKTLTSLRLMERYCQRPSLILFLAPSISLVNQTLREWANEAHTPFYGFAVCSDRKIGKDNEDRRIHDLALPPTTEPSLLAKAIIKLASQPDKRHGQHIIIFSTYQSLAVVKEAQKLGLPDIDLVICDEAHRTTGLIREGEEPSDFVMIHENEHIRATKRLYMTATPRIFNDKATKKAEDLGIKLYSMDDDVRYGPEFYRLDFAKAVKLDLLSEYKVLIVAVNEHSMAALTNRYNQTYELDSKSGIDINFATKIIGSWQGLSKIGLHEIDEAGQASDYREDLTPMRRGVAFSNSINNSKVISDVFTNLIKQYPLHDDDEANPKALLDVTLDHVDGGMNALTRQQKLDWLRQPVAEGEARILSNARCLSEGIDVPALDAVIFFDTRDSIVDIVQSVGRVMRKADGKRFGYIILPVAIPSKELSDYDAYIDKDPRFHGIWKVIKALRSHDESLVDEKEFTRKIIPIVAEPLSVTAPEQTEMEYSYPPLAIEQIRKAVYGVIPKKIGDLEYWATWAKKVKPIADKIHLRIHNLIQMGDAAKAFDLFLKGLQQNINPMITDQQACEMLTQHILTRPIFAALFQSHRFTDQNPVSRGMEAILRIIDDHAVDSEAQSLSLFYKEIEDRIQVAQSDKSKQEIIRNLYDTFFKEAFPAMAERLGIVYTPVPVVDFIINSVEYALQQHFKVGLAAKDVQILDPFTGTGTFITRLIQSGHIPKQAMRHKFLHELHANEIILLAYYIAAVNIETSFAAQSGEADDYTPFPGIVLTDTFQLNETRDMVDSVVLPANSERVNRQKQAPIRVIIGNPPYSAGQTSANDNNQNLKYPALDEQITKTYAAKSTATNKNSLYDSYIRALRWASDRLGQQGIIGFITNASFLDGNAADGVRQSLAQEFSHLYIFNLRGNAYTSGELRQKEKGNVFGSGSRTPVAITILIKDPNHWGECKLYYHDIGDYLEKAEKLAIIEKFAHIGNLPWQQLIPNQHGDWLDHRHPEFEQYMALGDKDNPQSQTIFAIYSNGLKSNRDTWVYNFSDQQLAVNMGKMIEFYNQQRLNYHALTQDSPENERPDLDQFLDFDKTKISWSDNLKKALVSNKNYNLLRSSIRVGLYRPFCKQYLYFNRDFNERVYQIPKLFPTANHSNRAICVSGLGARVSFSAIITDHIPDLGLNAACQCFPLYYYTSRITDKQPDLYQAQEGGDLYQRHEAISDGALAHYQRHYQDETIGKEDIFHFVYGLLHAPDYRQNYQADLKRMLPRLPMVADFWGFATAGRALAALHLNYESLPTNSVTEDKARLVGEDFHYKIEKMRFEKLQNGKVDKSIIRVNQGVVLRGIPLEAYDYVVNGKSAIEWVMDRYQYKRDKDSLLLNDPNLYSDNPRYIVDLLQQVIYLSLETMKIVTTLPPTCKPAN